MALADAIKGTRDKLAEVRRRLFKRRARVRFTHARRRHWARRARHWHVVMEQAQKEKNIERARRADELATRAMRKHAYWDELYDKAVLGRHAMREREKRLEKKLAILKEQQAQQQADVDGLVRPNRPWNPRGLQGPGWMVEWFDKAYAITHFTVVSWHRTREECTAICYRMCGRPYCEGTCGGDRSNHTCPPTFACRYPEGAGDLDNYYAARAALSRVGAPLTNHLPNDPVHVSHSGY